MPAGVPASSIAFPDECQDTLPLEVIARAA
jgi:hypothetical protein